MIRRRVAMEEKDKNATKPPEGAPSSGDTPKPKKRHGKKPVRSKEKSAKKAAKKPTLPKRPFPRVTLEEALKIPLALKEKNGGNAWPPNDVANAISLSPKNPDFFYLAAASRDFGLTEGSRDSEQISLTPFGRDVVYAPSKVEEEKQLRQALTKVDIFKRVLEYYKGANLPEMQYLGNTLVREFHLPPEFHEEFSRLFQENCAFLKIGSGFSPTAAANDVRPKTGDDGSTIVIAEPKDETGLRCFVAMPFKEREERHPRGFFDEVLRSLIAPAGRDAGFSVFTANRDGSDVIQATIVNQLLDADLVIADLTENNPNVLFELGLRIAEQRPVAIIRARGTPPIFDVDNMLRVYEYDPNLWASTVVIDKPKLTEHIKGTWNNRESKMTFIGILRERKTEIPQ
jgi:hypothetical protein